MRKIYKKLTDEQKKRGVIFSSCLSIYTTEQPDNTIHEVMGDEEGKDLIIHRLLDDKFFNESQFKYNIVRRG